MLGLEDQLIYKEFENEVGEKYDKIMTSLSVFQGCLRDATNKVKQRRVARMRKSTLHNAFTRNT
jgi:hypothetical protein